MLKSRLAILSGAILLALLDTVLGNGRLLVPPQRSSLWRDPVFQRNRKVFKNYDDHTLNCGGFWKMHEHDGKCGVCGDAWDDEQPRPNEAGGMFGRGVIGRTYSTDKRFIDTLVQVTSSISGYFEFNICPNDDVEKRVSRECLDQFPMRILSKDRSISYGRRYFPDIKAGRADIVELSLEIPDGLECTQCVLQWRWHGANNYGICRNGRWGKGCGEQPEIYNCADIAILPESEIDNRDDKDHERKDDRATQRPITKATTTTSSTSDLSLSSSAATAATMSSSSSSTTTEPTTTTTPPVENTTVVEVRTTLNESRSTVMMTTSSNPVETETSVVPEITTQDNTTPETKSDSTPGWETTSEPKQETTLQTEATSPMETTPGQEAIPEPEPEETPKPETTIEPEPEVTSQIDTSQGESTPGPESTPEPGPETTPEPQGNGSSTEATQHTDTFTTTPIIQMVTHAADLSTHIDNSKTELLSSTSVSMVTESKEWQQTTTEATGLIPNLTSDKMVVSTSLPQQTTLNSTEMSTSVEISITEETGDMSTLNTQTHVTGQSSVNSRTVQNTEIPTETTVTTEPTTTVVEIIEKNVTTESVELSSAETTQPTVVVEEQSTSPYFQTTEMAGQDTSVTNSSTQTTQMIDNTTASIPIIVSTDFSDITFRENTEIQTPSENSITTDARVTEGFASTESTTNGKTVIVTEREKQLFTTLNEMSQSTTSPTLMTTESNNSTDKVFDEATTTIDPFIAPDVASTPETFTTDRLEASTGAAGSVSTEEQKIVTKEPVISTTSSNDGLSTESLLGASTPTATRAEFSDTPSTPVTTGRPTVSEDVPLVMGNIITNTDVPKTQESEISLIDILNEISKLENITSTDLMGAISIQVNDSSSNINVTGPIPLTVINITSSSGNVNLNDSMTVRARNDINDSTTAATIMNTTEVIATQNAGMNNNFVTETTINEGVSTDRQEGAGGIETNFVTARTTRIVPPQGGRFGGGINVARITPLDQIVNIDLNIPGGDAHFEKGKNRLVDG